MENVTLGKWPRLLVVGDPVTVEQANEIIFRTNDWWATSNSKKFEKSIYKALDIETNQYGWPQISKNFLDLYRILDLNYLNNARILSSWIGGPHGWCDLGGKIFCNTWNIGKWPEVEEVLEDWETIAEAFPYLRLKSELVTDEGEGESVIGFRVSKGKVETYTPTEDLVSTGDWEFNASLFNVKDSHFTSSESEVDILWIEKTRDFLLSKFNPLV